MISPRNNQGGNSIISTSFNIKEGMHHLFNYSPPTPCQKNKTAITWSVEKISSSKEGSPPTTHPHTHTPTHLVYINHLSQLKTAVAVLCHQRLAKGLHAWLKNKRNIWSPILDLWSSVVESGFMVACLD